MQKDCTKRNLIYEVKCLTCEDEAIRNAEEEAGDDLEKLRVAKSKIRNHVYYGETHRSAFERGFEHLQDLARLSEKSHMLKHMVYHHEGEDFCSGIDPTNVVFTAFCPPYSHQSV